MKKLLFIMLLAATATCAAQRHPYNSRPYHPPDRPPQRETRRPQVVPPSMPAPRPQPVNAPVPKQDPGKRGK